MDNTKGIMDVESGEYRQNGQIYITLEVVPLDQVRFSYSNRMNAFPL